MEQRGKLYILNERELKGPIEKSGRVRAYCPVHGGDNQRSLSIKLDCSEFDPHHKEHNQTCDAGIGRCHNAECGAVVLVAEYNVKKAAYLGYDVEGGDLIYRRKATTSCSTRPKWQQDELTMLHTVYPRTQMALQNHERAKAYLAQRAIPLDVALANGLGYIPPLADMQHATPELQRFSKWCDRIIFPTVTPNGEKGFTGRTLRGWAPGMSENEHKAKIDKHNAACRKQNKREVIRWEKTYPSGYFNYGMVTTVEKLGCVEGPFDALAAIACGIPNVIAMGGPSIDARYIPLNICDVVLGLDGDAPGKLGAEKLAHDLRRKGIVVEIALPVSGKDWSEAYRLAGKDGLAPLFNLFQEREPNEDTTGNHNQDQENSIPNFCPNPEQSRPEAAPEPEREEAYPDWLQAQIDQSITPCWTCLDVFHTETPSVWIDEKEDFAYCAEHLPCRELTKEEIAERFSDALGWQAAIEPRTTLADHLRKQRREQSKDQWIVDPKARIPDEVWYNIPHGETWQAICKQAEEQGEEFTGHGWYVQKSKDEHHPVNFCVPKKRCIWSKTGQATHMTSFS